MSVDRDSAPDLDAKCNLASAIQLIEEYCRVQSLLDRGQKLRGSINSFLQFFSPYEFYWQSLRKLPGLGCESGGGDKYAFDCTVVGSQRAIELPDSSASTGFSSSKRLHWIKYLPPIIGRASVASIVKLKILRVSVLGCCVLYI